MRKIILNLEPRILVNPVVYGVLFLVTSFLRLKVFNGIPEYTQYNDTMGYLLNAAEPIFSLRFWAGIRPFTVPLFYKIFSDLDTAALLQLGISVICWGLLALALAQTIQVKWFKPVAFGVILLFSLSTDIILWEKIILSDSLSISLFALMIACLFWLLNEWHWKRVVVLCVVIFFFAFTRESNTWLVMMIGGLFFAAGLFYKSYRRYLFLGLIMFSIFYTSNLTTTIGKRWSMPFFNTFAERILTDYNKIKFFENTGMPVTPEVLSLAREHGVNNNNTFLYAPELQEFRNWYYSRAKSAYMHFLVADIGRRIEEAIEGSPKMVASYTGIYWPAGFSPILDGWPAQIIYQKDFPWLLIIYTTMLVGLALPISLYERRKNWIVPIFLILLSYPHAFLIYHGDTNELSRHAVIMGIQYRMGAWLLFLVAADYAILKLGIPNWKFISSSKVTGWLLTITGMILFFLPMAIDALWGRPFVFGKTQIMGMIIGAFLCICGLLAFNRQLLLKKFFPPGKNGNRDQDK